MIDEKIIEDSAVLINMAYLERRYIDKCEKNTEQLCATTLAIEINQSSFTKPEAIYRKIMRDIVNNKNNVLGDEAFKSKFNLYKTYKNDYGLTSLTDEEISRVAKRDCLTDIKRELIDQIKSVYAEEELGKVNRINELVDKRKTVTDLVEEKSVERQNVYKKIEELNRSCKTILPSEKIRNKYKVQPTARGTSLKATFEDGYVDISEDNGPKDASFLVRKSFETDPPTLHICFRGTDNKAKPVISYFTNEYPNMDRQYRKLRGVLNAIISEQIALHQEMYPGEKLHVHFSGHSLGAAMAERAIESHKDGKRVFYTASVFANPGSKHYLQKVVDAVDNVDNKIYKTCFKNKAFLALGENAITHSIEKSYDFSAKILKMPIFLTVGLTSIVVSLSRKIGNFLNIDNHVSPEIVEDKLSQSSLIPKIAGGLVYGVAHRSSDTIQNSLKPFDKVTDILLDTFTETKRNDSRMITINHEKDYIPEIGSKLFDHATKGIVTLDNKLEATESKGLIKSKLTFDYHNAYNYGNETLKMVENGMYKEFAIKMEKNRINNRIQNFRDSLETETENKLKFA